MIPLFWVFFLFFFFFFWESLTRTCLRDDMFHKFVIKAQYWHKQSWIINNLFMMECGVLLLISDLSTHFSFIHHFFSWKIFELQSITKRGMWTPSLPGFMRGCELKCSVNVNEAFPPNFTAWQVGNPHHEIVHTAVSSRRMTILSWLNLHFWSIVHWSWGNHSYSPFWSLCRLNPPWIFVSERSRLLGHVPRFPKTSQSVSGAVLWTGWKFDIVGVA